MKIASNSQTSSLQGNGFIKAAMLLTIGVFLVCAPAPDASLLSDMTSNLIVTSANPATEAQYPLNSNT